MPLEMWGGVECTLNRVREQYADQLESSGHAKRIEDLTRFAELGISALRYPVLWERVAPQWLDRPQWQWTDQRLTRILELGLRPIAGLVHHGSGPRYTSLLDPAFPVLLGQYAGMVAERYPWIDDYTPINEPLTTARFSGLYGLWFPHGRSTHAFVRALMHQIIGVSLAMRAIRQINPRARLIQTEDCGRCFGTPATARQVEFENHRRWLTVDLLAGRVDTHHPLRRFLVEHGANSYELDQLVDSPTPPQVVGLNYYVTSDRFLDHQLDRYPAELHGGNREMRYADVDAVRRRREGIVGHRAHLLEAWLRYRIPVALTEVHLACTREEQLRWLHEAWRGATAARIQGAAVVAVTPWALLGSYDWDSLVTASRGHYEAGAFDVRSSEPRPTAVAAAIRSLASGSGSADNAFDSDGWWRRPARLLYAPTEEAPRPSPARPLLVLGPGGTLGQAFRRVAECRGLPVTCAGRRDVDIASIASLRDLMSNVRPWAVINATGYVRVDDAERDNDACFAINTAGAVNVATACAELGVPLVTYSSDLVFDGTQSHPYTEGDVPHPLNVYGSSKAEAERRIALVLPDGLIVRTSAFFGPWDAGNFVARGLDTIRAGHRWQAASDIVVSPTYVPDLVNATLDLLQDRERGIWHLSNQGPLSWFDLARAAAVACGEPSHLVEPVSAAELGWPAARPAYSALASVRGHVMRSTSEALAAFAAYIGRKDETRRPEVLEQTGQPTAA
jgi:dTDP-4-dehydrorhamnose reductase